MHYRPNVLGSASRIALALALCCALILLAFPADAPRAASTSSAVARSVSGQVDVYSPGVQRRPLHQGESLRPGQYVSVGPGASTVLAIHDESTAELHENTVIALNDLLPQEQSSVSFSLYTGIMLVEAVNIRGSDLVVTPTLSTGIRGTKFSVVVADDGSTVVVVEEGEVSAQTDGGGEETSEVCLAPGQEVRADTAGAQLTPHEATMISAEQWDAFRSERRARLLDDPALAAENLEQSIDQQIERLEWLQTLPLDRAEVLRRLSERLQELAPGSEQERARVIMEAHMETARAMGLVRRFRAQRMRLESIFVRAERLAQAMEDSGAESESQARARAAIERISGRRAEVDAQVSAIAQRFQESVTPLQQHFQDFEELRGQGCPRGDISGQGMDANN